MPRYSEASVALSRRDLLAGGAALAAPPSEPGACGDSALLVARRWCALEAEQQRLVRRWQRLETWLFKHRNWPRLSEAERDAVPEAASLAAIEVELQGIDRAYDALLPELKRTPAATRAGVLAKLDALMWFLDEADHPDARVLLRSCRGDIARLWPPARWPSGIAGDPCALGRQR